MFFFKKITILHIFYRFGDHKTKKKFVTRDVTKFSPICFSRQYTRRKMEGQPEYLEGQVDQI